MENRGNLERGCEAYEEAKEEERSLSEINWRGRRTTIGYQIKFAC